MGRRYLETHPWIKFEYKPRHENLSLRIGEAFSKCQHLAGTPLQPKLAAELAQVYLVKGIAGTTAIEGNTLSEVEVADILAKRRKLPDSQQYLAQEVENVQRVLLNIDKDAWAGKDFDLTPQWLQMQNTEVLRDLQSAPHVVPGHYTQDTLTVGSVYRSAPPQDVPYLVEQLCGWVNSRLVETRQANMPAEFKFFNIVTTAILAHLFFVWIHPFGDGNGRTARALECAILATSGMVPWISSNLLSDYYNRTRSRYYERLAAASHNDDVHGFVEYALTGFVEMLREQIGTVQAMQREVAWVNYIHQLFQDQTNGEASKRRRALILAMPADNPTPRVQLRRLNPELAVLYAGRGEKTLSQDLNKLTELDLVLGNTKDGYLANVGLMDAFLPANLHP